MSLTLIESEGFQLTTMKRKHLGGHGPSRGQRQQRLTDTFIATVPKPPNPSSRTGAGNGTGSIADSQQSRSARAIVPLTIKCVTIDQSCLTFLVMI